jgi:hypothetical protein
MAKSLAGQDTALLKLIPSLRGVEDPLSELEKTFAGAAEAAADTDPYQRMQIIFGELQEQIGMALLPLLNEFSDWLATPEGQAKLQEIVDGIVDIITEMVKAVRFVEENKDWLLPMVAAIGGVTAAWNLATVAVNGFKTAAGIAAFVSGSAVASTGAVIAGSAAGGFMQGQALGEQSRIYGGDPAVGYKETGRLFGDAFTAPRPNQNVTINVNNGNVTAQQILDKLRRLNKSSGTQGGNFFQ